MKLSYLYWHKAVLIILLFIFALVIVATLFPLSRNLTNRSTHSIITKISMLWFRTVCYVLGVRFSVYGTPILETSLWVSNHISWLDIVILGALQPINFLAKSEVAHWPIIGFLARKSGNLFICRGQGSNEALEEMTARLSSGNKLVLFPEGTTTCGTTVRPFYSRLLQPAINAGVPIQPVTINYQQNKNVEYIAFIGDDAFLPHLLRLLQLPTIYVNVHFGTPLFTKESSDRKTLANEARSQIVSALNLKQ